MLKLLDFAMLKGVAEAIDLNQKLRKAGVKVFLYGMAGKPIADNSVQLKLVNDKVESLQTEINQLYKEIDEL